MGCGISHKGFLIATNIKNMFCLLYTRSREPVVHPGGLEVQGKGHPEWDANPSQDAITHYRQFRNTHEHTTHVFGLDEATRVPGGNP